ncbi:hypothetical protein GCM10025784_26270 [Citricoccus nitrophenolicus]
MRWMGRVDLTEAVKEARHVGRGEPTLGSRGILCPSKWLQAGMPLLTRDGASSRWLSTVGISAGLCRLLSAGGYGLRCSRLDALWEFRCVGCGRGRLRKR